MEGAGFPYLDIMEGFDEEVGLWWFSDEGVGGHTSAVVNLPRSHCGTISFLRLLVALQTNKLNELNVKKILEGVKQTQLTEGENAGEFLWYLEEDHIEDEHATFFNGIAMCAIYGTYRDRFTSEELSLLEDMLKGTYQAFIKHIKHHNRFYPNEYLGDLVCGWLIGEWFGFEGNDRKMIANEFTLLEKLWFKKGWGWGEHLSDVYGCICLDELSLILLLAKDLPEPARKSLENLFAELMEIDDLFISGPRVPTIREYSFLQAPEGIDYRSLIKPVPPNATFRPQKTSAGSRLPSACTPYQVITGEALPTADNSDLWLPLGGVFYELGWHKIAPEKKHFPAGQYKINCINGPAYIYKADDIRIGVSSKFPLIEQAEHLTYGLSWQSFPVSIWTKNKDWISMQWETEENGIKLLNPADDKYKGRFNPSLTKMTNPPIYGKTFSAAKDDVFIIIRYIPTLTLSWDKLIDRFRLIGGVRCVELPIGGTGSNQLVLDFPSRSLYLFSRSLFVDTTPILDTKSDNIRDWELRFDKESLESQRLILNLWAISFKEFESVPKITFGWDKLNFREPHRGKVRIRWNLHNQTLNATFDISKELLKVS